jgi:hypothetical protein
VQHNLVGGLIGFPLTQAFTSATQPGDLVVAVVIWDAPGSLMTVTDMAGAPLAPVTGPLFGPTRTDGGSEALQIFYGWNADGGSPPAALVYHLPVTIQATLIQVEYSGLEAVGPFAQQVSSDAGGLSVTSGPVSVLESPALLVNPAISQNVITDAGPGWTPRVTASGDLLQDRVVDAGVWSAEAQSDSPKWMSQVVVFYAHAPVVADGGSDAGSDGGIRAANSGSLTVGCGCSQPGPALLFGVVAALGRRRQRAAAGRAVLKRVAPDR